MAKGNKLPYPYRKRTFKAFTILSAFEAQLSFQQKLKEALPGFSF
jgi:hypothetical protein